MVNVSLYAMSGMAKKRLTHYCIGIALKIVVWIYGVLVITMELRKILQNIWRGFVCYVLNNIFPSNNYRSLLLPASFHQNVKAAFSCREYECVNIWFYASFSRIRNFV